jgi:hypothetical protein
VLRFAGKIRYAGDETVTEFEAGTASVAAWERYALRHNWPASMGTAPLLAFHVIAHHALGIEQGVDAWIETVDSVELTPIGDEAPPTPPAPSPA